MRTAIFGLFSAVCECQIGRQALIARKPEVEFCGKVDRGLLR